MIPVVGLFFHPDRCSFVTVPDQKNKYDRD